MSDTSICESFVNIDLNGEVADSDVELSQLSSTMDQTVDSDTTKVESEEADTPKKFHANEELERLSAQLMSDYAKYFRLNPTSQMDELNDCIENLLTHMEEFNGLVLMIRNEGNLCLEHFAQSVEPKLAECQRVYRLIDKLERIVGHVSMHVALMEKEVSKAERAMGKQSRVRKLFSLLSSTSQNNTTSLSGSNSSSRYTYVPPDLFKTQDLMNM